MSNNIQTPYNKLDANCIMLTLFGHHSLLCVTMPDPDSWEHGSFKTDNYSHKDEIQRFILLIKAGLNHCSYTHQLQVSAESYMHEQFLCCIQQIKNSLHCLLMAHMFQQIDAQG